MKSKSLRSGAVLLLLATAWMVIGCDEVKDAIKEACGGEYCCLDDLLEMAGTSREELGKDADKVIADALAAQEEWLGESLVVDCQAQAKNDELTKPAGEPVGEGVPKAEQGETVVAPSAQDVPEETGKILDARGAQGEDVVILLDATGSMGDDQAAVAEHIGTISGDVKAKAGRLALAWYKDNMSCDTPWYQHNASGLVALDGAGGTEIQSFIQAVPVGGGCDWPESLYDAVWEAATTLSWESSSKRMIIIITDAPPLEGDLSTHTKAQVAAKTAELGITLHTITVGVSY